MKNKRKDNLVVQIVLMILFGVIIWSGLKIIDNIQRYRTAKNNYERLEEDTVVKKRGLDNEGKTTAKEWTDKKNAPITVDFKALKDKKEAANVRSWLYIEALEISYPILQGTDNQYYLHRNIDGNYEVSGSIFMDSENEKDFSDPNTIIFGHNMADGSMFGKLKEFSLNNAIKKSPYIWILTENQDYCYQIFSAQVVDVTDECYTLFSERGSEFVSFLNRMKQHSLVETGKWEFATDDSILTLSTCNGAGNQTSRYIVQAVRINKGGQS